MKYNLKIASVFILCNLVSIFSFSQKQYPQNYFRSPVGIPIHLSASFGELRPSHFHSGIDIRTQGQIEKNIYAIADGYISRISVSPFGYGKALYITHPNGYVSVYAHLNSFAGKTADYTKDIQHKTRRFGINTYLPEGRIPVKKGQLIALSGNTGGSGGPHLHFEIRDAETEEPINPMLFNFKIKDDLAPNIMDIFIFPLDKKSSINGKNEMKQLKASGANGKFKVNAGNIKLNGKIGFGIRTRDKINKSSFKFGVYSIELQVDKKTIYFHTLERFSFDETLYINSLMDYQIYRNDKMKVQRCFVQPNNKLSIYNHVLNKGIVNFKDDKEHTVQFIVKDTYGNTSKIEFRVKSTSKVTKPKKEVTKHLMYYEGKNYFENKEIKISIPNNALYDNIDFQYNMMPKNKQTFSKIHQVHRSTTPLHRKINIEIKSDKLPDYLYDKALIGRLKRGGKFSAVGGLYENGFVTVSTRHFGTFAVVVDTIAPKILPLNIQKNNIVSDKNKIKFKITDELSGIQYYHGYIDGNWVLFEYDAKKDLLFHVLDNKIKKGKHKLMLKVADAKNNIKIYETSLNY